MPATAQRILIVDDEPDLRSVLRFGLEAAGFEVNEAADGEQGLQMACDTLPDLIVLDLMLPRMDGYKVCRALKFDDRYRQIPVFILSARTGETDLQGHLCFLSVDDFQLCGSSFPGAPLGANPESIIPALRSMDSGPAATRRPGMTE